MRQSIDLVKWRIYSHLFFNINRRQIDDLQCEVHTLKDQLHCRQCTIDDLEMQLTSMRASMRCLERELDHARDQKIELDVRKELCDKLDVEKEKLNAELNELNEIRKKVSQDTNLRLGLINPYLPPFLYSWRRSAQSCAMSCSRSQR